MAQMMMNCIYQIKSNEELDLLFEIANIGEIEIDGCVSDGQFIGNAVINCSESLKGISLEDINNLNIMSKAELDNMLSEQDMSDISINLGAY